MYADRCNDGTSASTWKDQGHGRSGENTTLEMAAPNVQMGMTTVLHPGL